MTSFCEYCAASTTHKHKDLHPPFFLALKLDFYDSSFESEQCPRKIEKEFFPSSQVNDERKIKAAKSMHEI
jgi:hypothetical protein